VDESHSKENSRGEAIHEGYNIFVAVDSWKQFWQNTRETAKEYDKEHYNLEFL
jgi:hypothetical protein